MWNCSSQHSPRIRAYRLAGIVALLGTITLSNTATVQAAGNPFDALRAHATPERLQQQTTQQHQRSLGASGSSVKTQLGSFSLDPTFIPTLKEKDGYVLIQLHGAISDEQRQTLKEHGVTLLDYIPDNTWTAHIYRTALSDVHALNFVRALGNIYPQDKLPTQLLNLGLSPRATSGEQVRLEVTFFSGIQFSEAVNQLTTIAASTEQAAFESGQKLRITLPIQQLLALIELNSVRWVEEPAAPIAANNIDSAQVIGVTALQQAHPNLQGQGIKVAAWEGAPPQTSHPDLQGRITVAQGAGSSNHATHVAGTMIGDGSHNPSAKGMAPKAQYVAYDFYGDITGEMRSANVEYNVSLNNHSWGYITGWSDDYYNDGIWTWFGHPLEEHDSDFGRYTNTSQDWDAFAYVYDEIVIKSSGNNRNDFGPITGGGHYHIGDSRRMHYDYHAPDGNYDSIDSVSTAKNIITVGAVDDIGNISSFSGWGPTDDGRIKPDVVANGVSVYSTTNNSGYGLMSGSSMATPAITGGLALLTELQQSVAGSKLSVADAKALIAHTAIDKGPSGPDYSYGWGIMNANAAASIIEADAGNGRFIRRSRVLDHNSLNYTVTIEEGSPELRTTIAWNDPPGSPQAANALVNDIDITLIDPNGVTYHPFTLGGITNPEAPARQDQANHIDNIEQVLVNEPIAGEWRIQVYGYNIQSAQEFTLITTTDLTIDDTTIGITAEDSVPAGGGGGSAGLLLFSTLLLRLSKRRYH